MLLIQDKINFFGIFFDIESLKSNMLRYFILFLSLIALASTSFAQEKINVRGKIYDKEAKEPVPYVHVVNHEDKKGTFSNLNGQFSLTAEVGDTLIFSAIGYAKYSLIITKQLKEVYLEIQLDSKAMELSPVKVFAYRDLESLKKAIVDMDVPAKKDDGISLNLPPVIVQPQMQQDGISTIGVGTSFPVEAIINGLGLNKDYNEKVKLQKLLDKEQRKNLAEMKYNPEIVKEWTGLEGDELIAFMDFCKLPEDFIVKATDYELAVAVHQCLDEYKEED